MRIHHTICVVLEHLLHTLVKLNETIVGEQIINVTIQQNAENVFNIYSIQVSLQQRPSVASKHITLQQMVKFPYVPCVGNFGETDTFLTVS